MDSAYQDLLSLFEQPSVGYRPMMFWVWNGDMEPERIRTQVADMAAKGCGGFFIHPMGESFRLPDFIRGIAPPYLSEGYFDAVRVAVEAARDNGILAWLYDEGGWPSGTAQGHVLEGHPEHAAQVLTARQVEAVAGRPIPCPEGFVAAYAVCSDGPPQVLEASEGQLTPPPNATGVVMFVVERQAPRVDLLSPAAVRRFIDVTHERYAECVGEFFGTVIPGMFTDEPAVAGRVGTGQIPWTDRMQEEFATLKGTDLIPLLPALFAEDAMGAGLCAAISEEQREQAKVAYYDVWTDLFREAFWLQINQWCEQHGIIHTGHVGGEDNLPDHALHGFGQFFKTAGALHAPGVDAIWRQLCWNKRNFGFPRFAASAARQKAMEVAPPSGLDGTAPLVITETNGVYGLGLTYDQMRWLVDYQCLGGVNLIAPMAYSYETRNGVLFRTQDCLGPVNPMWEQYGTFSEYVGRLCAVLRNCTTLADVALYYPIEALWADVAGERAAATVASFSRLLMALEEEQVAFDILDAETLINASVSEGILETPGEYYGTVVVPDVQVLPAGVAAKLLALYESGGRVAFAGQVPERRCDPGSDEEYQALREALVQAAVVMDRSSEHGGVGGDTEGGLSESLRWDGFSAAYMGPRGADYFAAAVRSEQAVLLAPDDEVGRLAHLLAIRTGRYGIQPAGLMPELRMTIMERGPMEVAFMLNEGSATLRFELDVVAEVPSVVERWDLTDGRAHPVLLHEDITELSRLPMSLRAGESALVVLRPLEEDEEVEVEPPPHLHELLPPVVIDQLDEPTAVYVVREFRLEEGDVVDVQSKPNEMPMPPQLGPWDQVINPEFSGTVAYEFSFPVAEEYLEEDIFLDLGEVCSSAQTYLNGEPLRPMLWAPYVAEVSGLLQPHDNELTILVTNTLANQVASDKAVELAKLRGWFNGYYERALPMMVESLRSGLMGPVKLTVRG